MAPGHLLTAVLLLALPAGAAAASLALGGEAAKERPVTKVITLLKDMQKQLEKEAKEDEEIYDKLACWCSTNDKEKSKSITDAEAKLMVLTSQIEEHTASSSRLGVEIKNLEREVAENQQALDAATALRTEQLAAFNAEEKELLESISALKAAITVLSKNHGGGAFLQTPRGHVLAVAATLQHELQRHAALLQGVLTPSDRKAVAAFVQAPEDFFDAAPTFKKQSYTPQSSQIFGILRQMKDTFQANLADSQKEETANQQAYDQLKAAKEGQIFAGQEQITTKEQVLAETDERNAQAREDVTETKAALSADEQFLMSLKEKCKMTDTEWEERQKTRQLEIRAVSKAVAVLSADDAQDVFGRTFALLQRGSSVRSARRDSAYGVLAAAAQKADNPRLAALAASVRMDTFEEVKKAIDEMTEQLLKEKADEIKLKAFCVESFNKNEVLEEQKERERQDLNAKVASLQHAIKKLGDEISTLKGEIAHMQQQLKRAGEDRASENKEHQATVADQRQTQRLLKGALGVLADFYGKKKPAGLVQRGAGPPSPPGFDAYKKNGASGGVMELIAQIISDAKTLEAESIKAEADAQRAYEALVKETNDSINSKSAEIVSKQESSAKKEEEVVEAKETREFVVEELAQLSEKNAQLHLTCDFVTNNFEVRQAARDQEVEALRQAKAILSGARFQEFLQGA